MAARIEPATKDGDSESVPSDRERGDTGDDRWFKQHWPGAVCCALYVVLAMAIYGHFGSIGPGHMAGIGSMDSIVQIWWLAWAAHALPNIHNLFVAKAKTTRWDRILV